MPLTSVSAYFFPKLHYRTFSQRQVYVYSRESTHWLSKDDLYCLQVSNQCTSNFRKMCLTDKKCVDQIKLEGSKRQPRIRIARTHQYEYRPLE